MNENLGGSANWQKRALMLFFLGVFFSLIWPVYPFFSRIHPIVMGIPFSLFYLILILVVSFLVLLGFYLWESRRGGAD